MTNNSVKALTSLRNGEVKQVVDTTVPRYWWSLISCPCSNDPLFHKELRTMKRHGQQLEQYWRKNESDQLLAGSFARRWPWQKKRKKDCQCHCISTVTSSGSFPSSVGAVTSRSQRGRRWTLEGPAVTSLQPSSLAKSVTVARNWIVDLIYTTEQCTGSQLGQFCGISFDINDNTFEFSTQGDKRYKFIKNVFNKAIRLIKNLLNTFLINFISFIALGVELKSIVV